MNGTGVSSTIVDTTLWWVILEPWSCQGSSSESAALDRGAVARERILGMTNAISETLHGIGPVRDP